MLAPGWESQSAKGQRGNRNDGKSGKQHDDRVDLGQELAEFRQRQLRRGFGPARRPNRRPEQPRSWGTGSPVHPGRVAGLPRWRQERRIRRLRPDPDVRPRGPGKPQRPAPQGGAAGLWHERPSPPPQTGGDGQAPGAVGYPMTSVSLSSTDSRLAGTVGRSITAVTPGTALTRPATAAAISTMTTP